MSELVTIEQQNALAIFTDEGGVAPILARVREEIDAFSVPDVSTDKGRKAIASFAHKVVRSKTYLDGVGKQLADEQKEIPKKIDAARRLVRETLDAWRDEIRRPLTEWEEAEQARVERHEAGVQALKDAAEAGTDWMRIDPASLRETLAMVERCEIGDRWEEFAGSAALAKDAAIVSLRAGIASRAQYDAEQAELARLRAEAARAVPAPDYPICPPAETPVQAENRPEQVPAEQAEAPAEPTPDPAPVAGAADAERQRRARINSEFRAALVEVGLTVELATKVVTAIANGRIPSVRIQY